MVSFLTAFGLLPASLDAGKPLRDALDEALRRPLASYARWPRVLGVLSLLLFVFLGITGGLLAFYYQPTAEAAYPSVGTIVRDVQVGWFVHQAHLWGARLLLAILLLRVLRFFAQGLYRTPREALWILSILTLGAATLADVTGRLLPWDARGYWSTVRAMEILDALPVVGPLAAFLVGGTRVDSLVLTRFYVLHVAVLPALLLALFYLHFSGVRRVGLSAGPVETRGGAAGYRVYLYDLLILTVGLFGGLISLATLLPSSFGTIADPASTPAGMAPAWYLLAPHALLEAFPSYVPLRLRGFLFLAILGAILLLPFLDRSGGRAPRERRLVLAAGLAAFLLWVFLTWQGHRLERLP